MNAVFCTMLSGNIFFLLIKLAERLDKDMFSQRYRYALLKCALLLHVIPLGLLKTAWSVWMPPAVRRRGKTGFFVGEGMAAVMVMPGNIKANDPFKTELAGILVWCVVAVGVAGFLIMKQKKMERYVQKNSHSPEGKEFLEVISTCRKKLRIRRKVCVKATEAENISFTMGILHPLVVLPEGRSRKDFEKIAHHELYHVKKNDSMVLLLCAVISGIYWFNPLVWWMAADIKRTCELACDEAVIKEMGAEEKRSYARLIIEMASPENGGEKRYVPSFSNSKNAMKERIDGVMKKRSIRGKIGIFATAGIILCSIIPAWAYESPQVIMMEGECEENWFEGGEAAFVPKGKTGGFYMADVTVCYDFQFTDEAGNIYEVIPEEGRAACEHEYTNGEYQEHIKNSSGGCTIKIYEASMCVKCGKVASKKLISTTTYPQCPH